MTTYIELSPRKAIDLANQLIKAAEHVEAMGTSTAYEYVRLPNNVRLRIGAVKHETLTDEEYGIARALVMAAINAGYTVSVNDGVEYVIARCSAVDDIMRSMGSTDSDVLVLRSMDGQKVGWVEFIWGNGCDVIANHTDNQAINALVAAVPTE